MKKLLFLIILFLLSFSLVRVFLSQSLEPLTFNSILVAIQNFNYDFSFSIDVFETFQPLYQGLLDTFKDCSSFDFVVFLQDFFGSILGIVAIPVAFIFDLLGYIYNIIATFFSLVIGGPA